MYKRFLTYINGKGLEWISRADFFILLFPRILSASDSLSLRSLVCLSTHTHKHSINKNLWQSKEFSSSIHYSHAIMICRITNCHLSFAGMSEWDFNCQWLVAISKLVCGSVKWWDQVESSLALCATHKNEGEGERNEWWKICERFFIRSL